MQEETCALVGYKASDASTKPLVFIEYLLFVLVVLELGVLLLCVAELTEPDYSSHRGIE